jgi:F-type H+-transporting ATPase subunit c
VAGEEENEAMWIASTRIPTGGMTMNKVKTFLMVTAGAVVATFGSTGVALAEEAAGGGGGYSTGAIAFSAALAISLSAFGAALGQGRAVAAAMESIGRNPNCADRIQTPMIIGLALMEALAIYGLIIAFILTGKF